MTAKEKELVKVYKNYIHFLGNEYDAVFTLAYVHGYNCSESKSNWANRCEKKSKSWRRSVG